MAFVRRKGNSFYLVHNVRRGEKVIRAFERERLDWCCVTDWMQLKEKSSV